MEDALERVRLGRVEDRLGVLGAAFLLLQAADPFLSEGVEGVADGSDGAPDPGRDLGGPLALGAGQEDLGTPERERPSASESGLEFPTLRIGQLADK